jgi:hypothetical protein
MMCAMSEDDERAGAPANERDPAGVLSNLPRTRPQRSSARRIAARDGASNASTRSAGAPASERQTPAGASSSSTARSAARDGAKDAKSSRKPKARAAAGAGARAPGAKRAAGTRRKAASSNARRARERAPRQGFESEGASTTGSVMPPGGAELLNAATELLTDVAKSGLARGASTLKGIAGRLRPR